MKVLTLNGNYDSGRLQVGLIADSAIIRTDRPMFVPRWADEFLGTPALAYRVSRLGKTIASRFAMRYCDGVAPALMVHARGLDASQSEPRWSALATTFDGALLLGSWRGWTGEMLKATFTVDGEETAEVSDMAFASPFRSLVELLSRHCTLKTGDIIVSDAGAEPILLVPGMTIEASLNQEPSLVSRIK